MFDKKSKFLKALQKYPEFFRSIPMGKQEFKSIRFLILLVFILIVVCTCATLGLLWLTIYLWKIGTWWAYPICVVLLLPIYLLLSQTFVFIRIIIDGVSNYIHGVVYIFTDVVKDKQDAFDHSNLQVFMMRTTYFTLTTDEGFFNTVQKGDVICLILSNSGYTVDKQVISNVINKSNLAKARQSKNKPKYFKD